MESIAVKHVVSIVHNVSCSIAKSVGSTRVQVVERQGQSGGVMHLGEVSSKAIIHLNDIASYDRSSIVGSGHCSERYGHGGLSQI